MPDQSPADVLRSAATLMRTRANSATVGPWMAMAMGSEGYLVLTDRVTIRDRGHRVARFGLKDWDTDRADAEYVASMHPGVAKAFAAWLDDRATDYFGLSDVEARVLAGDASAGTEDPAITVARTYLGETSA